MMVLGGCRVQRRRTGGTVCRQPAPWGVGWDKVIGIIVEAKKRRKNKEKPRTGYCRIYSIFFE